MHEPTLGSLFSGCGGLDLGLERGAGLVTRWQCQYDPDSKREQPCNGILERHWPGVPNLGDITAVDWAAVEPVDVLAGGFPCQDLSYAGRGAGIADGTRSRLWFEFAHAIRALRPRVVVVENVPGLITRGLGVVLANLAEAGYDASWGSIRAADVGAPHRRERVFVVAADADGEHAEPRLRRRAPGGVDAWAGAQEQDGDGHMGTPEQGPIEWGVYDGAVRQWEHVFGYLAPRPTDDRGRLAPEFVEWMLGYPAGWTAGVSRTARLKMLGNSVQVQVAEIVAVAVAISLEATS